MNPTSILQGGSSNTGLQGNSANIQGSSPNLQGSSPNLQASSASAAALQPQNGETVSANGITSIAPGPNAANEIASLLQQNQSLLQADVPGVPISINTGAIQAQANQQAQNQVNPLYTQYLNQYTQQLAGFAGSGDLGTLQNAIAAYVPGSTSYNTGLNGTAEQQNAMNIAAEQAQLQNTLAQNTLQQQAAGATNALTQGNINVQQQNYQLTTGMAQNAKIQSIEQSIGSGNLGASGLGQQQLYQAENARNIADAQQLGQFQYDRDTSNLSTNDTFEQLAQSSAYATTSANQAEAQTNFNLMDYLRQAAYNDQQYQEANTAATQQAINATTQNLTAQGVQNAINSSGVSGKNFAATEQAYQPYLSPTSSMPGMVNSTDYLPSVGANV